MRNIKPICAKIRTVLIIFSIVLVSFFSFCGCDSSSDSTPETENRDYDKVPPHFPPIPFPESNPYSPEKVELGRMLFYEKLLSKDSTIASCSHCMKQDHAFGDCTPVSYGLNQEPETRNTMSLQNAAYRTAYFWDGRGAAIESPAYRSLYLPVILGSDTNEIKQRLMNTPPYPEMFRKAFGDDAEPDAYLIAKAIATFVRTLVSGNSRYDKYLLGDKTALNQSELNGMELFFNTSKTNCSICHSGLFFTDLKFHNTGTTSHYFDRGRYYITKDDKDRGKFITPTLRNVEVTAPYTHDGEYNTLLELLNNYNIGGRAWENKATLMKP